MRLRPASVRFVTAPWTAAASPLLCRRRLGRSVQRCATYEHDSKATGAHRWLKRTARGYDGHRSSCPFACHGAYRSACTACRAHCPMSASMHPCTCRWSRCQGVAGRCLRTYAMIGARCSDCYTLVRTHSHGHDAHVCARQECHTSMCATRNPTGVYVCAAILSRTPWSFAALRSMACMFRS